MDRYVGLDAHATSCTFGVIDAKGKQLGSHVVETNGKALVDFIRTQAGKIHLCMEEGTQSAWLYEILAPHVDELIVVPVAESKGPKNDARDALALAERMRTGSVKTDKHPIAKTLKTIPGLGPTRVAQLVPVVVTPHRFRTKRQFWSYCGLGIVMRSSSDWVRGKDARWIRTQVPATRGLNPNPNHLLKWIFKGAAKTVVGRSKTDPLHQDYERLLAAGTKPNLALLTLARKWA